MVSRLRSRRNLKRTVRPHGHSSATSDKDSARLGGRLSQRDFTWFDEGWTCSSRMQNTG